MFPFVCLCHRKSGSAILMMDTIFPVHHKERSREKEMLTIIIISPSSSDTRKLDMASRHKSSPAAHVRATTKSPLLSFFSFFLSSSVAQLFSCQYNMTGDDVVARARRILIALPPP